MTRTWFPWDWCERPSAPLTWMFPERMVVLVEHLVCSEGVYPIVSKQRAARADVMALVEAGGVAVTAERHPMYQSWPRKRGLVPALLVERKADLDGLAKLRATKAKHCALVVRPKERIELDEAFGVVDLVVVRADLSYTRHAEWARLLRDQCAKAKVAFAYPDGEVDEKAYLELPKELT